jgi:hypothetical protein
MSHFNTTAILVLATFALSLSGCGILKKKQPEPAASAAPTLQAPAPVATPAPTPAAPEPTVAVADESVPTPEDFEDEAFDKVTDKTYKAELAALKKELDAK